MVKGQKCAIMGGRVRGGIYEESSEVLAAKRSQRSQDEQGVEESQDEPLGYMTKGI